MDNSLIILHDQLQPQADRNKLESPLELLFIENLEKYLSHKVEIIPQFEIETFAGKFRMDFLLKIDNKTIAFECDGKEFHNEWRDEWRDSLVLGTQKIDTIYRFRGKDLFRFANECIYLIYYFDKELFNDRYTLIAPQLISIHLIQKRLKSVNSERINVNYEVKNEDEAHVDWVEIVMKRRNKNDKYAYWNTLFEIAKNNVGKNLEQLMEIKQQQQINSVFRT